MSIVSTRTKVTPVEIPRTRRQHKIRAMTSLPAGKFVPIHRIPVLREDAASVSMQIAFQMQETVEVLMNSVVVDVQAWLVPMSAAERFIEYGDVNRAYKGEPRKPGDPVIPYFETGAAGVIGPGPTENQILHRLGRHAKPTDTVNLFDIEAYNLVWNHIAANLSPNITPRARLAKDLAPGFWPQNMFDFIKPDFDEKTMEGAVGLTVVGSQLPLKGVDAELRYVPVEVGGDFRVWSTPGSPRAMNLSTSNSVTYGGATNASGQPIVGMSGLRTDLAGAFAELQDNGITVSLANIELAKQTQAWANIRKQYNELPEEFLIDLLMDGIQVPELMWQQPIRLAHQQTTFGMAKRYASDGGSLTESVVNGAAGVELRFSTPKVNPGGVIMIFAQIAPEQLFERMEDPWLHATSVDELPAAMRDILDPQKVQAVPNRYIDIDHDTGNDLFGYAPTNYKWMLNGPAIGGRFYRPEVDAPFDEDRQMLWAVETQNPALTEDFYLISDMHLKPFWTSLIDPFDALARGEASISGLTQFGPLLIEKSDDDYDAVLEQVDQGRIDK